MLELAHLLWNWSALHSNSRGRHCGSEKVCLPGQVKLSGHLPWSGRVGKSLPWWGIWRFLRGLWCNLSFCSFLVFPYCSASGLLFYFNVAPSVCSHLACLFFHLPSPPPGYEYCKVTSDVSVWQLRSLEILQIKRKYSYLLWVLFELRSRVVSVNLQHGMPCHSVCNPLVLLYQK